MERQVCTLLVLSEACNLEWSPLGRHAAAGWWRHTGYTWKLHQTGYYVYWSEGLSCYIYPPLIWGECEKHRAAANLVCNNVQLYDTSRSGSGLLADNVEHFAHQFLNRDTHEKMGNYPFSVLRLKPVVWLKSIAYYHVKCRDRVFWAGSRWRARERTIHFMRNRAIFTVTA